MPRPRSALARLVLAVAALLGLAVAPAAAHPHVFITARASLVFDGADVTGLRITWVYDDASTEFQLAQLPGAGFGRRPRAGEVNLFMSEEIGYLDEWSWFVEARQGPHRLIFDRPRNIVAEIANGLLFVVFDLPFAAPVPARGLDLTLSLYDPTFFNEIKGLDGELPATEGAPAPCRAEAIPSPEPPETEGAKELPLFFRPRQADYFLRESRRTATWHRVTCG